MKWIVENFASEKDVSNFAKNNLDITGCKKDSRRPRDRGQYGRQRNSRVIHLERVYYRSRGPARLRRFARVNTGSEHCYSLYDSLKTIFRGTSSPSNPNQLPVYNLRKSTTLKLTIIFVPS